MEICLNILAVIFLLASGYFAYQYLTHREAETCDLKNFFSPKLDVLSLCLTGAAFLLATAIYFCCSYLGRDTFIRAFMNAEVMTFLLLVGYIDLREKIIPNGLIGIGLAFWGVLFLLDVFVAKTPWLDVLMLSALGGLLVGGVLFVIALIVKSALGMGDVKLFFVLGLLYGAIDTYSILLFSMFIMAVVSLILLIAKKVNTKTAIPMAPFVAIGFALCILAGM